MAEYSLYLIPKEALSFNKPNGWEPDGTTPWSNYHASSGSNWNGSDWQFTFSGSDVTQIDIHDNDNDPGILNDDSWWNTGNGGGQGTQTIQTAIGGAQPGDDITDEYELNFTAMVDGQPVLDDNGEPKIYTLAAIATGGNAFNYIGFTFDGEWPPEGAVMQYVQNSNVDNASLDEANMLAPCFTRGVRIQTPTGEVLIEDLRAGDLVMTVDHGAQPIRWIGSSKIRPLTLARNPRLTPIRIKAGALGPNTPQSDLLVSPQHRILARSRIAQRMFGTDEVLVAAKQLLQLDGIDIAEDITGVEYFHMLFDRHEVVISNGAPTESLYTGAEALNVLGAAAREEIFAIFPELLGDAPEIIPARHLPSGRMARKLAVRHLENQRSLI